MGCWRRIFTSGGTFRNGITISHSREDTWMLGGSIGFSDARSFLLRPLTTIGHRTPDYGAFRSGFYHDPH